MVLYYFDTRKYSLEELLKFTKLSESDFSKYKIEESKKEKIASTYLKNKYVGKYYLSKDGKPLSDSIYFNISHSKGVVVLAIHSSPIGVDIEKIRDVDSKLINYISNELEKEYIKDNKSFFEVWTSKESLVKCIGTGIKEKPNKIPSLPINGKKLYNGKTYFSKVVEYQGYVISITIENSGDFDLSITEIKQRNR